MVPIAPGALSIKIPRIAPEDSLPNPTATLPHPHDPVPALPLVPTQNPTNVEYRGYMSGWEKLGGCLSRPT